MTKKKLCSVRYFCLLIFTARVRSTTGRLCFDTCLSINLSVHMGGGQVQLPGGGVRSSWGEVRSSRWGGVRSSRGVGQVQPGGGVQVQLPGGVRSSGGGGGEVSKDRTT